MSMLWLALRAEMLKLKRTLALWMVLLAPFVIFLAQIAVYLKYGEYYLAHESANPWKIFNQTMLVYWAFLMLPLFIMLESALLNGLEHNNRNWKLLYVQPIPRWAFYAAKWIITQVLIGLSMLIVLVLMLIGGVIISWIYPEYPFSQPFPWAWTLELIAQTYLSAGLILSLHVWISARWSSFIVAAATGVAAEVIGIFAFSSDYVGYFPWTIPGVIATQTLSSLESTIALILGLLGGIVIAFVGGWAVIRRDVL